LRLWRRGMGITFATENIDCSFARC
jgi:hypothetical protein